MHFAERYFNLFHYVLEISVQEGKDLTPWQEVYDKINELVKQEEERPLPPGFTDRDFAETLIPILLWIDETFLNSKRPDAAQWYDHHLQRKFFDTNQGGEMFFQHLEELLLQRRELFEVPTLEGSSFSGPPAPVSADSLDRMSALWIKPGEGPDPLESRLDSYSLCLVLGYRGRMINEDPEKVEPLKELARQQLESWAISTAPKAQEKPRRRFPNLGYLWRCYGWIVVHLLLPSTIIFLLWLYYENVINSLPY
jgi:hypothetical protein